MKKIIGFAIAMAFTGALAFSVVDKANAGEVPYTGNFVAAMGDHYDGYAYKNITSHDKFVAALGDNYEGYSYKNITSYDKFVASLGDGYQGYAYRNVMDADKFVAALGDNYEGYSYKNITNHDKFVASLGDGYQGYAYRNVTDAGKFVAALADAYVPERSAGADHARYANLLNEKYAEQAASGGEIRCSYSNVDFLTDNMVALASIVNTTCQ